MKTIQFIRKSSANGENLLYAWFEAMHTRVDLLLYAGISHKDLEKAAIAIQDNIRFIESIANRFDFGSELYYINKNAFANPCPISETLAGMIRECLFFREKTYGCFDITVNSFNNFRSGAESIDLNFEEKVITFQHPDVQIDLNGYVKGYALRDVPSILSGYLISNALINMGNSSILALGNHPHSEKGWRVGMDPAFKKKNTEVTLVNECLTTSGNSLKNQRHIIDPETGKFIEEKNVVSVMTSDPALGEILSTALFVADNSRRELICQFPFQPPIRMFFDKY